MERDAPFPEPMVYSLVHISRSPQLWGSTTKWGKTYDRHPRIPTQMEGLHTMGCGLVPRGGSFTTLLLLHQCNEARCLSPWLGQTRALLANVCPSNPLNLSPLGKYELRPAVKKLYQLRPNVSASRVSVASQRVCFTCISCVPRC